MALAELREIGQKLTEGGILRSQRADYAAQQHELEEGYFTPAVADILSNPCDSAFQELWGRTTAILLARAGLTEEVPDFPITPQQYGDERESGWKALYLPQIAADNLRLLRYIHQGVSIHANLLDISLIHSSTQFGWVLMRERMLYDYKQHRGISAEQVRWEIGSEHATGITLATDLYSRALERSFGKKEPYHQRVLDLETKYEGSKMSADILTCESDYGVNISRDTLQSVTDSNFIVVRELKAI